MAKEGEYAQVRLPSGEVREVHIECYATIGQVGNLEHENVSIGKAGRNRWMGFKPHDARRLDEPGRPPDGRRRGEDLGRPPPDLALGMEDEGYEDAEQQADGRIHRPPAQVQGRKGTGQ